LTSGTEISCPSGGLVPSGRLPEHGLAQGFASEFGSEATIDQRQSRDQKPAFGAVGTPGAGTVAGG
jgi:hypothetical protein